MRGLPVRETAQEGELKVNSPPNSQGRTAEIVTIRIPLKLPFKNQLTPSPDRHAWIRFISLRQRWMKEIPPAGKLRAFGPRSLRVVRIMGPRERRYDTANLIYVCAALFDLIKDAGYLVNDSEVWCELRKPVQRRALPGERCPATLIELEDL